MVERIVVVSGRVASGKSELAKDLCARFEGLRFSTHQMLVRRLGGQEPGRRRLQEEGERLDRRTKGSWLRDDLARQIWSLEHHRLAVVDSARILGQIEYLRESFGRRVVHVHVTASEATLRKRYEKRRAERSGELPSYVEVHANPTEAQVESLSEHADLVIDTDKCLAQDVLVRAACALELLAGAPEPCVDAVIGGEYGSEGKGNIAFYLAPEYNLLVRVGGPNAGHKIVLPSGETYTHHQLPSGTRAAATTRLLLGPGNVLNVETLLKEIADCEVDHRRLAIDPRAMIIEPQDSECEAYLEATIGSTRQGVGWATARRLLRGADPKMAPVRMARDVPDLEPFVRPATDVLEEAYAAGDRIQLEGTQGTGLSLYHGSFPHVTSRDTGVAGALSEAGIAPHRLRRCVLVCRTYPIRVESPAEHTSGPMSINLSWAEVERRAEVPRGRLRKAEKTSTTNKQRRVGEFEWDLLRKSALINGPTDIALTFVDYLGKKNLDARRFEQLTEQTLHFIEEVERVARAPVSLISTGFSQRPSIVDRRIW
jgi:adenylosuccinate synthase